MPNHILACALIELEEEITMVISPKIIRNVNWSGIVDRGNAQAQTNQGCEGWGIMFPKYDEAGAMDMFQ